MKDDERLRLAADLMNRFAAATGLSDGVRPQRYLWTDAFAVCNFLGLRRLSGETRYLDLALRLADQVHRVLGRHREDDARRGWISGLGDEEGARHPTRGGLRIGKPLPERRADEPFDARAEWERDGQYLHYLTQWMHALHRLGSETGNRSFDAWSVELAQVAHAAFLQPGGRATAAHYAWKMSIDLRRALVPSPGQHDALDAFVCYLELGERASVLTRVTEDARRMVVPGALETDDPLGIGGLLLDACRLAALLRRAAFADRDLLARLISAAALGLAALARTRMLEGPASSRLAFRELGLAIGLHAVEDLRDRDSPGAGLGDALAALLARAPPAGRIDAYWAAPSHRQVESWTAHRHINDVMLATSLLPVGCYLGD